MQFSSICPSMSALISANLTECYDLTYDVESPSLNEIKNMHYMAYKRIRTEWKFRTKKALEDTPIITLDKAFIVVERKCSGGGLDWDNAYGGLKPILDCLVCKSKRNPDGLGLITDDSPNHMPWAPFVLQTPAKKSHGSLRLRIFKIEE